MAEEITRELIQEIVVETIQTSSPSIDTSWVSTLGIIVSIFVLAFSVYKFSESQKRHNITQEKSQMQFNETQEKSKNVEFMKQIEYYDKESIQCVNDFANSNKQFNDCSLFATRFLGIMSRLSYFRIQELVNQDFINYYEWDFNSGKMLLNWLKFTNRTPGTWDPVYPDFLEIHDTLPTSVGRNPLLESPFYYYVRHCVDDSEYIPAKDNTDPSEYVPTQEDVDLIDT